MHRRGPHSLGHGLLDPRRSNTPQYYPTRLLNSIPSKMKAVAHIHLTKYLTRYLITGRYLGSQFPNNEVFFSYVFQPRRLATRELLRQWRTKVMGTIKNVPNINLLSMDAIFDTITGVTRKADNHQEAWMLTNDMRFHFPSATFAKATYTM